MKHDTCLYPGGASRRGQAAASRSRRLLREVLTCAGTLLALYGATPVHALSGFLDTGDVGFFIDPQKPKDGKFYCDWRFGGTSPPLAACAQHDSQLVAVQVNAGFALGLETNTTISSTYFGAITTSTVGASARVALICETAGDGSGLNHCLRITEGGGGGPAACTAKFANITANATQCAADLARLQPVFGPTAHIDFTTDRNAAGRLNVNICTPASWVCADGPSSLTGLGDREIQQIDVAMAETPGVCSCCGTSWYDPHPPCP
jgi:hypothetical protein